MPCPGTETRNRRIDDWRVRELSACTRRGTNTLQRTQATRCINVPRSVTRTLYPVTAGPPPAPPPGGDAGGGPAVIGYRVRVTERGTLMQRVAWVLCSVFVPLLVHADSSRTRQSSIRRFLVSVPGQGITFFDLQGVELWSFRCDPYDACELTGGQILVTERRAGRVFIVTREKKIVWEQGGLEGPVNAE